MQTNLAILGLNIVIGGLSGAAWCLVAKIAWKERYEWVRRLFLGAFMAAVLYLAGVSVVESPEEVWAVVSAAYLSVEALTALELKQSPPMPE